MSDTDKKTDEKKFNDTLKRMLDTPHKPSGKDRSTTSGGTLGPCKAVKLS